MNQKHLHIVSEHDCETQITSESIIHQVNKLAADEARIKSDDSNKDVQNSKILNFQKVKKIAFDLLDMNVKAYIDDSGGAVLLRLLEGGICKQTTIEALSSMIGEHLRKKSTDFSADVLRKIIKTWIDGTPKLTSIPASFSVDKTELTFNRININPVFGQCPTWDDFIKRCGANGEAVKAFTYSIFEKADLSRQYLFLKGEGRDGKGSYIRWLNSNFNDQLAGLEAKNDHWPSMCVGKRIGVFNDLVNTQVVLSSQFKQITGGDKVTITQKYEKAVDVILDTKFIITSNKSASFLTTEAERRRVIYVELVPSNEIIVDYELKLKLESDAFLFKCREAYNRLYKKDIQQIKCDYSGFDAAASSFEESTEALFESAFEICKDEYVTANDFIARLNHEGVRDSRAVNALKEWMTRNRKIKREQKTIDKKRVYVYEGMKMKPKR